MRLTAQEQYALSKLFRDDDATSVAIRAQIDGLRAKHRIETKVGFLTRIQLSVPLAGMHRRKWDWTFEHVRLEDGGSFACWLEDENAIELDAVTHGGEWPTHFDAADFRERDVAEILERDPRDPRDR
ncbi:MULTISPECIES: hypothetical protein [unclassified Cupriavidus]|uniref:hypothetical protein n=1 Tax=unclassified Cupriavidus TaxID=2640874 RepID=UPI00313F3BFD